MCVVVVMYWFLGTLIAITSFTAVVSWKISKKKRAPLPPGPKGYPIIGNLFDIPKTHDPTVWATFKDVYGELPYVFVVYYKLEFRRTHDKLLLLGKKYNHFE